MALMEVIPVSPLSFSLLICSSKTKFISSCKPFSAKISVSPQLSNSLPSIVIVNTEDKEYCVRLKKPKGITEISVKTMTVNVYVDNSSSKEIENISVQSQNLDPKYKVQALTVEDRQVTVTIYEKESENKNLTYDF